MKAVIKNIALQNFKGCKNATYTFDGKNATVSGQNGAGKTTIATAFYWVFADKDTELKSNPPIRPLDAEECTPRVDIVFDIDGREVSVAKLQKQTKKGNSVSLSNTYEVNAVEYGERDFKAKMNEYGIDFDLFLPLSHTDVFTGQKSADMRKVLFAMASEKSDKEIADLTDGASDVAKLLENYTVEEVKAMQNATIRKIKEVYGKDGEILRAKIEGMEQSKVDIDVAELELQRSYLKGQIALCKEEQDDISKQFEEYQKLSDGIMELKFAESDLVRKANEELVENKRAIMSQIDEKNDYLLNISNGIQRNNREIANYEYDIETGEKVRSRLAEQWKSVNDEVFDESTAICPTCHRELPAEEIESLRSVFAKSKTERLAKIEKEGTEAKQNIENAKAMIPKLQECNKDNIANKNKLEKEVADLEKQLSELPSSIDISDTEEYKAIQKQIAEKEQAMSQMNNADDIRKQLKADESELQAQLTECEKKIALSENNDAIDGQIADLRAKQIEYEQNKADAERILHQIDLVSRKKNELLSEEVNSHFKLVKFRLFDYLKNGEYKDDCTPLIDEKPLATHSNGALNVLAKLDIIAGLQNFYGQFYTVFADDFSLVTGNTADRIDIPCQLIKLCAVDDVKELRIEVE